MKVHKDLIFKRMHIAMCTICIVYASKQAISNSCC